MTLLKLYQNWLNENIEISHINDWECISIPFLNRHNDWINIYIKEIEKDKIIISDGCETIQDLVSTGLTQEDEDFTLVRHEMERFNAILNDGSEITMIVTKEEFPIMFQMMIQCLVSINSIFGND